MTYVLVVEETESFSDPLSYLLGKAGFEVAVCATGFSALDTFDRHGADLVLLDLTVHRPPALEVCRRLRARSSVPVIALNGRDTEFDMVLGLGLGADDYVPESFSWPDLLARIRAVLGSRQDETVRTRPQLARS